MEKINFWELFKKAFYLSWTTKKLWWLGLIIGSGSSLNLNFPFPGKDEPENKFTTDQISSFVENHLSWIIAGVVFLIVLLVFWGLLQILAYSALVREFLTLEDKTVNSFGKSLREGKKYFWRVFKLRLFLSLTSLALLLVLALPAVFLFFLKSFVLGGITSLLAFLIFIPALIIFFFLEKFGTFYIITSDLNLRSSLEQGYKIFLKNVWPSLIMSLLFLPLSIVTGIITLTMLLIISLPFIIPGVIFYQIDFISGVWVAGILGGTVILILSLGVRSFLGVFHGAAWFLFFKEIATAKKEVVEVKEGLAIGEEIQPEKA